MTLNDQMRNKIHRYKTTIGTALPAGCEPISFPGARDYRPTGNRVGHGKEDSVWMEEDAHWSYVLVTL